MFLLKIRQLQIKLRINSSAWWYTSICWKFEWGSLSDYFAVKHNFKMVGMGDSHPPWPLSSFWFLTFSGYVPPITFNTTGLWSILKDCHSHGVWRGSILTFSVMFFPVIPYQGKQIKVYLEPRGFLLTKECEAKRREKRQNTREPLGAHIRSFECTDPIWSCYWDFWVRFWHGNLKKGFWLDWHVERTYMCVQRFSCVLPCTHLWLRKPLGSMVMKVLSFDIL